MNNNFAKKVFIFLIASFLVFSFSQVIQVNAGSNNLLWDNKADGIQANTGLGNDDPRFIAANIINIVLGFLGIIALILILYAGFKWMTAAGNEDRVTEAKKLLVAAVIGLIIILSAFALSSFVLDAIFRATTS